jgi:hypothetical protein
MSELHAEGTPAWSPLTARQRRVLGTLMEKSKTTPDAYPMTFAALTTGCNQKSNRAPITNLTTEQVEQTVDELKALGAVTLVHGNGRVEKIRHYAYQWLGISKVESAIMTELLLRGEQTLGELRTRASRLEPIPDLGELQKLFHELQSRNLVVALTPPGRGQIVSHNLYPEWELEQLQKKVASGGYSMSDDENDPAPAEPRGAGSSEIPTHPSARVSTAIPSTEFQELREAIAQLATRLDHLERELGVTRS